jgi:SOS-response transcriptional repressor LexA
MDTFETRRTRLNLLVEQLANDNVTEFAKKYGYSRAQIYQFLSRTYNSGRSMGERAARELEKRIEYPSGWLDQPIISRTEIVEAEKKRTHPNAQAGANEGQTKALGIPVLGDVSATDKGMIIDTSPFRNIYTAKWLPIDYQGRDLFAIRNIGVSLAPRIKSGEYLVIERFVAPRPGDDVLLKLVSGERYILQFLYIRNSEMVFGPVGAPIQTLAIPEASVFSCERIVVIVDEGEPTTREIVENT